MHNIETIVPKVSILVVSFNTREMTLDCLRSIAAETRIPHEVILVDNASKDGSAEAVAQAFPEVRLMAETENHGFAKANNIAAERARGEYVLLLNPDTVVLDGAIDRLVAFAEATPQAMIWGGRTLYGDGRLNPTCCWRRMTLWNVFCRTTGLSGTFPKSEFFNSESYGDWQRDQEREVDIVCGAFLLIRRAFWQKLGGFDLRYVMYGEEADLCLRARDLGARPRMTPEAQIIHYVGASEQLRGTKVVMVLKAKIRLIRDHFPAWQRAPAAWLFRLWPLTRYGATAALARVKGSERLRDRAEGWREVWSRRAEWWNGWA
ncbi:glycosyltransferase family 2 protein [Neotabrizicola sp. sgz301269]|uniref:glycosyltransferase family 2 protein n=1 Tax=Neotabrizicola sp. sgz301269 TaxID=3276282 RepID=UPI00376F8116